MARLRLALRVGLYILAIYAVLAFWGAHLPREHIVMETIDLPAPPAEVYAVVRDLEAAPSWRTGLQRVELLPDRNNRKLYREVGDDGAITYEIAEDQPGERFVTAIADIHLPYSGRWVFQFAPTESGGTRLTLTEVGDVTNPVLRLFGTAVGFEGSIKEYLADLRAHLSKRGA